MRRWTARLGTITLATAYFTYNETILSIYMILERTFL